MRTLERLLGTNEPGDWLLAGGIVLLVLAAAWTFKSFALRRLQAIAQRTDTVLDDLLVDVLQATYLVLLIPLALYLAAQVLSLPERPERALTHVTVTALLLQAALWTSRLIAGWLQYLRRTRAAEDPAGVSALNIVGYIARVGLWAFVLLLALDNFGFNITALLAGLGIGGVAVALAAQSILGDLFASLSIVFDRPFVVGDFIVVGEHLGTVEYIGLKTTRLRSLSGEQIVFANSDLLKSRIHNYKRMNERRVRFQFGVVYQTPPEKLEAIPGLVREIVEQTPRTRFDRAHFRAYGDSSLDFEVVYYVLDADYNVYMDVHQAILFVLFRRFREHGIDFAYPTRTLYLNSMASVS
jgi:small-conductance mechanosensitive channel